MNLIILTTQFSYKMFLVQKLGRLVLTNTKRKEKLLKYVGSVIFVVLTQFRQDVIDKRPN